MARVARGAAPTAMHGFTAALTSFVGRAAEVAEVAGLLEEYRLVTVTGPGGVGKTRLADEVARRVADRFADGAWLIELAGIADPALVPRAVATALGVHQDSAVPVLDSLVMVLARQQVLLVLDNCEHVLAAVAELCGRLLRAADDVRILATSREPVGMAGETNYRLQPLGLPLAGDQSRIPAAEAVMLFTARARQSDPHFSLDGDAGPLVARLVARLDGMPLAVELAAAWVETLGVAQLLDRLDDRFRLLTGGDRTAAARHRSLAAAIDWSYRLLGESERQVFRRLAVFPGPFTLEAAEAVAGPDAALAVLHLVACSLLVPPRGGQDGRARYLMLETLRGYARDRLAEAGEQDQADADAARYALLTAEEMAVTARTRSGEPMALRWLDAEEATLLQSLTWALEHDRTVALRLAVALAPWWVQRGRTATGYAWLGSAAAEAGGDQDTWCAAQYWLGILASYSDGAQALEHYTAAIGAANRPSPTVADAMANRARGLCGFDRFAEARDDAHRALTLARELDYPAGEVRALFALYFLANAEEQVDEALALAWEAERIAMTSDFGKLARMSAELLTRALADAGKLDQARRRCADGLSLARDAGDLTGLADFLELSASLALQAGDPSAAAPHIHEGIEVSAKIGYRGRLGDFLDDCGHLCAATQRWADALTLWAAHARRVRESEATEFPQDRFRRQQPIQRAEQALGPAGARAARERGAAMTLATAAEYAALLAAGDPQAAPPPRLGKLSPREQELTTLVARGLTDAQIAGQLFISVRTVRTHLDRIRDKSGCRRRADLTRLALQAGLV